MGFDVPYRTVQGITESLSEYIVPMQKIHFTQIRRRLLSVMKKKKFEPKDDGEPTTVLVDSTGISTTKKGSYIEEMWRKEKREFVKLYAHTGRQEG